MLFFHENSEGPMPLNMALFLVEAVEGPLKARELHLFPRIERLVDAVDVLFLEKSWSSIFLGSLGT